MVEGFEEGFFGTVRVPEGMVVDNADIADVDDVLEVDVGKEFGGREFLFFEERRLFLGCLELFFRLHGFFFCLLREICILLHLSLLKIIN